VQLPLIVALTWRLRAGPIERAVRRAAAAAVLATDLYRCLSQARLHDSLGLLYIKSSAACILGSCRLWGESFSCVWPAFARGLDGGDARAPAARSQQRPLAAANKSV